MKQMMKQMMKQLMNQMMKQMMKQTMKHMINDKTNDETHEETNEETIGNKCSNTPNMQTTSHNSTQQLRQHIVPPHFDPTIKGRSPKQSCDVLIRNRQTLPGNSDTIARAGFHQKSHISTFFPSTRQSTRPKMKPPTRSIQLDPPNPFVYSKLIDSMENG